MQTLTMPQVQGTATGEQSMAWLRRQQEMHGDVPRAVLDGASARTAPASNSTTGNENSIGHALNDVLGGERHMTVGGVGVIVSEPTMRALKKAISKLSGTKTPDSTDPENMTDEFGRLLPEFEALMLNGLSFSGDDAPGDPAAWFNGLRMSEGLRLVEAFVDVFDFSALMQRVVTIAGKLKAAQGAVSQ